MGRRGIKEYRAPEALILIAADREHKLLVCPSCGSAGVDRTPRREGDDAPAGRVAIPCPKLPACPDAQRTPLKIRPHRTAVRNGSAR